jgi:hypothetical protein
MGAVVERGKATDRPPRAAPPDVDRAEALADGWDELRHDHLGRVGFYREVAAVPGREFRLCRLHVQRDGTGLVGLAHGVGFEAPLHSTAWAPARREAEARLAAHLRAAADGLDPAGADGGGA